MGSVWKYFALSESKPQLRQPQLRSEGSRSLPRPRQLCKEALGVSEQLCHISLSLWHLLSIWRLPSVAWPLHQGMAQGRQKAPVHAVLTVQMPNAYGTGAKQIRKSHHIPLTKMCCKLRGLAHLKTNDTSTHFQRDIRVKVKTEIQLRVHRLYFEAWLPEKSSLPNHWGLPNVNTFLKCFCTNLCLLVNPYP